ncbi:MAG: hypothetical protein K2M48_06250, partial [Clostridiales bacterium]|nr:hypothetical protein [Clostridiales bacterium]
DRQSIATDAPRSGLIKNSIVAAGASVAMLCLAAMPSLTMYVNGMGGRYLYYPGTVGTVYYSHIEAMIKIGLGIPDGAITVSIVLGIIVSVLSVFAATTALYRLYNGANKKDGMFNVLLTVIALNALALIIAVSAISAGLQADGTKVKYIVGASWYVNAALMLATAVFSWVIGAVKRKGPAQAADVETKEMKETTETTEDETALGESAETAANVTEEIANGAEANQSRGA